MVADARVQANAVDDGACVQPPQRRIGVQLIEVSHPQRQVGVGKQFDRLGFGQAGEQRGDILLAGALLQQRGKFARFGGHAFVALRRAHHDAAGVEVVIQRMAFAQKFRAEQQVRVAKTLARRRRVAHRHRRFDHDRRLRRIPPNQRKHVLHAGSVEIVFVLVIVGRRRNDDPIRPGIRGGRVGRGPQVKRAVRHIVGQFFVCQRAAAGVDVRHALRHHIHGPDLVVLGQQHPVGKPYIAHPGHGDLHTRHPSATSICPIIAHLRAAGQRPPALVHTKFTGRLFDSLYNKVYNRTKHFTLPAVPFCAFSTKKRRRNAERAFLYLFVFRKSGRARGMRRDTYRTEV